MPFVDIDRLEIEVRLALEARRYDLAGEAVGDIGYELHDDLDQIEPIIAALARIISAAQASIPDSDVVILWALRSQAMALRALGRFDDALEALICSQARGLSVAFAGGLTDTELLKLGLFYSAGRFQELLDVADSSLGDWLAENDADQEMVVEALWLRRFAAHHARVKIDAHESEKDQIRERLISNPFLQTRLAAIEGTWRALWLALTAKDSACLLDGILELDNAFGSECHEDARLVLGQKLVTIAGWLISLEGAFFPGAGARSLALSRAVADRFADAASGPGAYLLASALCSEYQALSGLGRVEEQVVVVERLTGLGSVAVEVLGGLLSQHPAGGEPEVRAWGLILAMLRAMALAGVDGCHDEAISMLDAGIDLYDGDTSDVVQEVVARMRFIRSQLTEPID